MLNKLIQQARQSKDWSELEQYCLTPEFQKLPYEEKNKPFMTASKLKCFKKCPLTYKLRYVDCVPDPTQEKDYFITGQAIDDLLTNGIDYFEDNYEIVKRRGESEKTQLTESMGREVDNMFKEFNANKAFNHNPKKRVFFHEFQGFILKAELDDYETGIIRDIKSTASVITFNPEMYVFQMAFYQWLVYENTLIDADVYIEAIDKYKHFSRSKKVFYSQDRLLNERAEIARALGELEMANETGLFMRSDDANTVYNSPYYGHPEYGRWEEEVIY